MNGTVVAFPDGDGGFANKDFWKGFFEAIGCTFYDKDIALKELCLSSDKVFPKNVCLNSKYRLGRALALSDKATHFVMFLRDDPYVTNCPASVYRINWIKDYFSNINVIVWKHDLHKDKDDIDNLLALTRLLKGNEIRVKEFLACFEKLPYRKPVYDFSLSNINKNKKTVLLIGVAPHLVDKYRKSELMDYILTKVNIIDPMSSCNSNLRLQPILDRRIVYYKDDAIINSCNFLLDNKLIDGILFVSDPFDIPGKYSFPKYKIALSKRGIKSCDRNCCGDITYLDLSVTLNSQHTARKKLDKFFKVI